MKKFILGLLAGVVLSTSVVALAQTGKIFSDVPSTAYYAPAVNYLEKLGVMQGYENGKFGPEDVVTRGQLATTLKRYDDSLTLLVDDYCQTHKIATGTTPTTSLDALCGKRGKLLYLVPSETPGSNPGNTQPVICTMEAKVGLSLTIKDEQGNVVKGAKVVFDEGKSAAEENMEGIFSGFYESAGHHTFVVTKDGFKTNSGSVDILKDQCHVIPQAKTVILLKN